MCDKLKYMKLLVLQFILYLVIKGSRRTQLWKMSQSSLFSIVCCWACSPCSVFDASQLTRGWRWSKIEPWSLLSSTARIAREILLPGRAAIWPSAGEVPCQKHPSKFCCAPRWCIHQQNALSVSTYGALYIYHPHLLCAPEEVSVPSYFASLGDLQSSPYKPAKDNETWCGAAMEDLIPWGTMRNMAPTPCSVPRLWRLSILNFYR